MSTDGDGPIINSRIRYRQFAAYRATGVKKYCLQGKIRNIPFTRYPCLMQILVDDQNKYIHLDGWVRTSEKQAKFYGKASVTADKRTATVKYSIRVYVTGNNGLYNRPISLAVALFRLLAAMPTEVSTRVVVLPGRSSLYKSNRGVGEGIFLGAHSESARDSKQTKLSIRWFPIWISFCKLAQSVLVLNNREAICSCFIQLGIISSNCKGFRIRDIMAVETLGQEGPINSVISLHLSTNAKELHRAQNEDTMSCRSTGSALTLFAVRGSDCTFLYKFSYMISTGADQPPQHNLRFLVQLHTTGETPNLEAQTQAIIYPINETRLMQTHRFFSKTAKLLSRSRLWQQNSIKGSLGSELLHIIPQLWENGILLLHAAVQLYLKGTIPRLSLHVAKHCKTHTQTHFIARRENVRQIWLFACYHLLLVGYFSTQFRVIAHGSDSVFPTTYIDSWSDILCIHPIDHTTSNFSVETASSKTTNLIRETTTDTKVTFQSIPESSTSQFSTPQTLRVVNLTAHGGPSDVDMSHRYPVSGYPLFRNDTLHTASLDSTKCGGLCETPFRIISCFKTISCRHNLIDQKTLDGFDDCHKFVQPDGISQETDNRCHERSLLNKVEFLNQKPQHPASAKPHKKYHWYDFRDIAVYFHKGNYKVPETFRQPTTGFALVRAHRVSAVLEFPSNCALLETKLHKIGEIHSLANKFGFASDSPGTQLKHPFVMFLSIINERCSWVPGTSDISLNKPIIYLQPGVILMILNRLQRPDAVFRVITSISRKFGVSQVKGDKYVEDLPANQDSPGPLCES
ncbi:hypothetical protein CLF_101493 [Clonorchis sinensis]|uniref:Uncharacterized protein n=1 Tax=Clonorchis sinensis TaxID=79923 RepID=G7Y5V9_CLOSI|nr:hypothetical protein CLF_101493 [Clonorchis sinensis]